MNEQAFQDAYNLFVSAGYKKSIDEFRNLIATNPQALQDSYNLFVGAGYTKDMPSYKALMGLSLGSQQTTAPRPNPNAGQQPQQQQQPQPQPEVQEELMQGVQPQAPQQQYNKLDYKAVPEQQEPTAARQIMSGVSQYVPGFEESMQQLEAKKKVASELELSAQKELVDYTSKQLEADILSDSQQYEADVQKNPLLKNELLKDVYQQVQRENRLPEFVKNQLEQIDVDLIGGAENRFGFSTIGIEERAVPKLNYMFGPLGFTFEEYGAGDYALAKAPNGESYVIGLDNLTKEGDVEEVNKLKSFITTNAANIPNIASYAKNYAGSKKKFLNDEEVDKAIEFNNTNTDLLATDIQSFVNDKTALENEIKLLNETPSAVRNTPEFKLKSEQLNNKYLELAKQQQKILQRTYEAEAKQRLLKQSIGKYMGMQGEQGTWLGASVNWLSGGAGTMLSGAASPVIDMYYSKYATGIGEKEMASQVGEGTATGDPITDINNGGEAVALAIRINKSLDERFTGEGMATFTKEGSKVVVNKSDELTSQYIPLPKAGESYKDWYKSLTENQKTALVDKYNDDTKKAVKKEVNPIFRELFTDFYGNKNTTKQWQSLKEEGFWGGAYAGLAKSLPAMIGGAGPVGWAQRTAQMYAQTSDAVYKEMENNPEFKDISESEKLMVVAPIGIATAVLEAYGLRNLMANKGFMNSLVLKAIGKSGATTTAKTFQELIKNEVNTMAAKGLLTLTAAGLAEGETGLLQQVAEYGVKDIYNAAKGKKMFDNPEFMSDEYVADVLKSGAQEAVGGFIMGVPNSVSNAFSKQGYFSLSDTEFKAFENIANDSKVQSAFISDLRNKVATGEISSSDAKQRLNDYRNSVGLYRSVDPELSTEAKKQAMNLIQEKTRLKEQIEGKDEAIVSRQKNRIAEINVQLNKLSENAVQEQTTSEVPIQSETTISEEVEGGKPTAEPQVTTEEVTQEEVVPAEQGNRRVDLFPETSDFAQQIGRSSSSSNLSNYTETNGIGMAEYANPETGVVDVIMSGTSDNDYVGYVRIYENGKPTNRWTSKMSNKSGNKDAFKTMISQVQSKLPENHEYTETTNISLDGLRVYGQQLNRGYEVVTDNNGKPVMNSVNLNQATREGVRNAKSQEEQDNLYTEMNVETREDFNKVREEILALMPTARVMWNQANNTVNIQLPVLRKTTAAPIAETTTTEEVAVPILQTANATASALEALPENDRTNIRFMQEDGTETPVMGNEKMLAELFQQAQAVPEEDRTDFHQNIIDVVTLSLSDQIEEETQQQEQVEEQTDAFQDYSDDDMITFEVDTLEEVPEEFRGITYESGPMEVTARKGILGLPIGKKRVVKRKGKTFRFTISGLKAKTNAKVLEGVQLINTKQSTRPERATTKAQLFANVSKSLASIFPNVGIRNFKNNEEMKAYVDSKYKDSPVSKQIFGNEGGMIIYDEKGNPSEIIINDKTSTATTLPHEVWHAILVKAFGENEALFKEFRDEIRNTLVQNGFNDIVDALDKFSSSPEYKASNKQAQEWLVEFGGLLTASGVTMENIKKPEVRNLLNQIKEIFNKITLEMFGFPAFLDYADAEQILDFIVSMSDSLSRGEDISKNFSRQRSNAQETTTASTVYQGPIVVSKQINQNNPAEEVRRIAQRYNVSNTGFAPSQVNEFALDKELRPYGYSAKRAAPDANGRQRGVYILNPKGRFYNPFKGKFQKVSKKETEPKKTKMSREKQVYNAKVLANKLARLTGIPVKYIDDPEQMFKGKIEDRVAIINLAYVTADTPIHEILGHPVIASLKETDREFYDKLVNEVKNSKQGASILARIKEDYSEYTEEQQIEEAIVEMISLMTSNRLENNSELKKLLTKILDEIIKLVNKGFNTNFGKGDTINLTALSKDIENYVNEVEGNLNRDLKSLVDLFLKNNTSTYLSVQPNEITQNGRKILEKKFKSESLARSISTYIIDAPLYANKFIELVDSILLDPRQAKAFFSEEKNMNYVNVLFGSLIGRRSSQKGAPIEDPFNLLSQEGYDFIPIKDFNHLLSFRADYDKGYVICTFKSKEEAQGRLDNSFVFWIRKPYASEILPYDMLTQEYLQSNSADAAEWRQYLYSKNLDNQDGTFRIPTKPSIYDPYAVSSVSLQIHKDPESSFQKMVNRYNHEIDISKGGDGVADAAFGNNLNNIVDGLENSIRDYVDLPQKETELGFNTVKVGDKLFVGRELVIDEYTRVYISENGYVEAGYDEATRELFNEKYHELNPDTEILSPSGYVFNRKNKTVKSLGNDSFFDDAVDVQFSVDSANRNIVVVTHKNKSVTELTLNDANHIIYISSDVKAIGDNFMSLNKKLKLVDLPLVEKIGDSFLLSDNSIRFINIPNVKKIGKMFMANNDSIETISLPSVETIDVDFLKLNNQILYLELPKLKKIVGNFMTSNSSLIALVVPELKTPGWGFLTNNNSLRFLELPSATSLQNGFLPNNENIEYAFLGYSPYITDKNVYDNNIYNSLKSFKNKNYSEVFSKLNEKVRPALMHEIVDNYFVRNNKTIQEFLDDIQKTQGITVSAQRGGVLQENLEDIPGYNDMIRKSKNIALRTSRRYGADWNRIMNAVMEFVMNSPVYTLASDVQREQLVRNVRAEFGKKEKTAPSPTKVFELPTVVDLFGPVADVKMITMPELQFLNEQIKTLVRGAKEARVNWMAISKQIAKQIKELVIAGKISNRQAASVISRLAMVNMFNQDSIDKFTDYMVKVFNDANYDKKINDARKKLPRALKNLRKKIGVANAVAPSLFELFSINPNLIPDSVLERYLELVDMFGSSDSVLKLDDVSVVAGDVKKILDVIYKEVVQSEELALRFEEFTDKVYDEDGKLDYAKTLAKMIEKDAITDAEAEIMRKYKKNILPKVEAPEKTKAEIEAEKKELIKAIKATTINASNLPTRLERDLVKRLVELLKPEYLKNLSVNQLENVVKLIDNINNGYMPRYAQITVEKLNSVKKASEELVTATETAKPLRFSKAVGKTKSLFIKGSTATLEMIRRTPLAYIDQIFGDFNTKRIFNAVFEMMATGHAAFETDMNKVNKKLDDAHQDVAKSHGKDANKTLEASFRMMVYMIQREYESNPGSDQVNPAARFIEATIDKIYDGKSKYKEADAALLEAILKDYGVDVGKDKNGNPIREIDNKKLYKSFNTAERGALKTIREINDSLTEKAQYTASVIRGESITPLNNYVHLPIMHDYNPNERSTGIQNSDAYNNSRKPSTKAKTLEGRSGDVSAINFDAFASAQKGAKATLLDFHLTEAIRTSRKTINEARKMLKESGKFKGQNRELINAIDSANEEVIRNVLTNNFITDTGIEAFVNEVSKQGYRAILASSERFTSELASNVAFAMISDPKSFVSGTKYKSVIMSPMAVDIMFNVGSKQTKRLFSADNLSGKFIDTSIIGQASGVRSNTTQSALSNVSKIIYNKSLKKYKNYIELVADGLISTPDKLVMRPVWFGSFANEFKRQTGVDIDFNKIGANDEAYMNKYSEAISNARNFADEKSVLAGASDNPFMGIIKGSNNADQGYIKKIYNNFNNFMTRFAIYEFAAARQGIYAAMGDGTLTRKEGAALLAGVATRMTTYTLLTKVLGGLVLSLFGIDDEDEETEKSFMQKFGQSLASTATSLIIGRDFGNAVKTISNFGVEKVNEEFFTDLRNGEYDPYEDAISYSSVPKGRPGKPVDFGDIALMFTGSFTPFAKTIDLGVRKAFEDAKKEPAAIERQKNEILVRLPIEVLGNIGLIPMYKDVKNIVVGKIYEDLKKEMKAEKEAAKEREIEKQRLGIYESREDMKRYNPKLYEKTFGPSSPYYKQDQVKKEMARMKSEAKRAVKDIQFGYDPDRIPSKDEMTRSELKRYFPQDYYKKYGAGSPTYKEEQEERDMEQEVRDARQAQMDAYYGYQSESKTDKFGAEKSSTKTDKFGAPILKGGKTDKFGAPIK